MPYSPRITRTYEFTREQRPAITAARTALAVLCLLCVSEICTAQQRSAGTIAGVFDVSNGGSARYSIPLHVSPGTAGTAPDLSLNYDSQASGGVLGAGWSLGGITAITRGPRTLFSDGVVDGVRFSSSDALYLDGSKLIEVGTSGSGPERRIEYRKENDDISRVLRFGNDDTSARFIVQTKGGVVIIFDGSNGSTLRTADGKVLMWGVSRIIDSPGNYLEFRYTISTGNEQKVSSIRYTGHGSLDAAFNLTRDQEPYAAVDFEYEELARPIDAFVSGTLVRRTARLRSITSRVGRPATDQSTWSIAGRYSFDYEDRTTANRSVLSAVHQFGDDGSELEPTTFRYSAPASGWKDAGYQLPIAVLATQERVGAGYAFVHFSDSGSAKDLLFSALIDGKLESYAFRNDFGAWTALEDYRPPFPFVSSDGSDLGALILDLNGDGRADLLQSTRSTTGTSSRSAYLADKGEWLRSSGFDLPFDLSTEGKRNGLVRAGRFSGSTLEDIVYDVNGVKGFLKNTGTGWQIDPTNSPPFTLSESSKVLDANCDGRPDLLVESGAGWRVWTFVFAGWSELASAYSPNLPAGLAANAVMLVDLNGDRCLDIIASSERQGFQVALLASSNGFSELPAFNPPFFLTDSSDMSNGARLIDINGDAKFDVVAHRLGAKGNSVEFAYLQSAGGWSRHTSDLPLPPMYDERQGGEPQIAHLLDLNGDGIEDIAVPTGRRDEFGRVFVNTAGNYAERPQFAPQMAFARHDQQDRGIRFVDLNGDGLQDVIFRRDFSREGKPQSVAGAFINTGRGWQATKGLEPPEPFASETIAGNPAQLIDVDLDGYVDLLYSYRAANGTRTNRYYRNVAEGAGRKWSDQGGSPMILPSAHPVAAEGAGDQGVRFIDLNGDGRVDMLVSALKAPSAGADERAITCATDRNGQSQCTTNRALFEAKAFLNDGKSWSEDSAYTPPLPFVARSPSSHAATTELFVQLVDVDGDRLPDLVARFKHPRDQSVEVNEIWLNTGKGWKLSTIQSPIALDAPLRNRRALIQWLDVNADGLADLLYSERQGATNNSRTWLTTGRGFVESQAWQIPVASINDRGGDPSYRLVDLNGDGWLDILYARKADSTNVERGAYLNSGTTWVAAESLQVASIPALIDENGLDLGVRLLDVDGNGLLDVVKSFARSDDGTAAEREALLNTGRRSDVLAVIDQGFGRSVTITYQTLIEEIALDTLPSRAPWTKVYTPPTEAQSYPLVAPVPTAYVVRRSISRSAGNSVSISHRYGEYRMHIGAMRSVGYGWRESFNETSSILTRTEFSQDIESAGREKRSATCIVTFARRPSGVPVPTNLCPSTLRPQFVILLGERLSTFDTRTQPVIGTFPSQRITQVSLRSTSTSEFELEGGLVSREFTSLSYDEPADLLVRRMNVRSTLVARSDGSSTSTSNLYDEDNPQKWYFGRITSSIVTRTGDSSRALGKRITEVRQASYRYDTATGLLVALTAQPGDPLATTTQYSRDAYGNVIVKRTTAAGEQARSEITTFDSIGRFVVAEENAEGHTIAYTRWETSGRIESTTNPNNLTTRFVYDGFGRPSRGTSATGVVSVTSRVTSAATPHSTGLQAAFAEVSRVGDLPEEVRIFDANARLIRTVQEGFTLDGTTPRAIYVDLVYDALGRVVKQSLPYDRGGAALWLTTKYDDIGRAIEVVTPTGRRTRTLYASRPGGGRFVTVVDPKGRRTVTELNSRALTESVLDAAGGRITFGYDAADRRIRTVGPTGAATTSTYDVFGLRRSTTDANRGTWTYDYDAFGQLVRQTDANGQRTILEYDRIGRLRRRSIGRNSVEWTYDAAAHGIGMLKGVRDPNRFEKSFFYDAFGRPERLDVTIGTETFSTAQGFDKYGRTSTIRYSGSGAQPMVIENTYDAKGYFTRVTGEGGASLYWQVLEVDAQGRVRREAYGNGVTNAVDFEAATGRTSRIEARSGAGDVILDLALNYDDVGNVKVRKETVRGIFESFKYDSLDRLTESKINGSRLSITYDLGGRIRNRGDVGTYRYRSDAPGPWAPHDAVLLTSRSGRETTYRYDNSGNAIEGAGRGYVFTAENRLQRVTIDATHSVQFDYDPDGGRYRQLTRVGSDTYETIYAGMFERVSETTTASAGQIDKQRFRLFLTNPNGTFAVIETVANQRLPENAVTRVWYLHRDQLGSIVRITDDKGALAVRYWYNPWGRRTDVFVRTPERDFGKTWARGFTGHEHLIGVELVHMNGRVYDAVTGMFLSADPVEPGMGSQALNRYAYAFNNPLRFTDPTGYWSLGGGLFGAIVGFVVGGPGGALAGLILGGNDETREWIQQNWREVAVAAVAVGITVASGGTLGPVLAGMAAGAASGGLHAALYGGSFDDILAGAITGGAIGAVSGAAFYGVGEAFSSSAGSLSSASSYGSIVAHGTVGGSMSAAQGGNFWTGFSAAAFTKASSMYGSAFSDYGANVARAAVVGGTAASISGGKFANGAIIGAFSYAFNDAYHAEQTERDPYAMPPDVADAKVQLNIGSSVGVGPKLFDVTGSRTLGFGMELGVVGMDYIPGSSPSPNFSPPLPCPMQLCSLSFGAQYHNYTVGGSAAFRGMPLEVQVSGSVNLQRGYEWVESSIYRMYGAPRH